MAMRVALSDTAQKVEVAAAPVVAKLHADHTGHRHDHDAPERKRRFGEWLFLASAFDRLLFVILVVALIWLAVVWAMG
ncbi:hypothetical protein C3941_07000 [Kaistia algarum]|nr:hypothetical protein C3941_07000 [Kaistia algarum]